MYEEKLKQFYREKISIQMKTAFLSSIILGFAAHGYMLANKLPNYDDIGNMINGYGVGIESGRWMLTVLGQLTKYLTGLYSLPWFNGILSLCIMGAAACLVVCIFDIKDCMLCALTGAIMVVFPAVTGIFFFMFTVIYYTLSILICAAAVYCFKRYKYGSFAAVILIAMAVAVYQAQLEFVSVLFLLMLLTECLSEQAEEKHIFVMALKCLAVLCAGLAVYLIGVRFFLALKGVELINYQGINELGKIRVSQLPELVKEVYVNYFALFYRNVQGLNLYPAVKLIMALIQAASIFLIAAGLRGKSIWVKLEALLFLLLLPAAAGLMYIAAPGAAVYSIMLYSVVMVYVGFIVLLHAVHRYSLLYTGGGICVALAVLLYCHFDNAEYLAMTMQYEQAYSYMTTLVTRIKSAPGYEEAMRIALVGNSGNFSDNSFDANSGFVRYEMGGRSQTLLNVHSRREFLVYYIGLAPGFEAGMDDLKGREAVVEAMPSYPDDGSVQVVDDIVVVKLGDL